MVRQVVKSSFRITPTTLQLYIAMGVNDYAQKKKKKKGQGRNGPALPEKAVMDEVYFVVRGKATLNFDELNIKKLSTKTLK